MRFIRFLARKGRPKAPWGMAKRSTSVTVKMTQADSDLLARAAETIWPGALLTKSSIVLGLARIGAESVLKSKKR
jgi:hypothetical protein